MKKIIHSFQLLGSLLALSLLTGCALTTAQIPLSYIPQDNVSRLSDAENITVTVVVDDQRDKKDSVGAKKNGFGMEMAPIVATNGVATLLKDAIETELTNRGFNLGTNNAISVVAELNKFYNEFKEGFWAGDAVAEVTMNILIKNQDGRIIYSKIVSGHGIEPNIQLASGENARLALNSALKDALEKMFNDTDFIATLLKANKP
jgi:uncharacterized lipoprotein YajG